MAEQNTQALVLQQPKDQIMHLDLQHSTDWVVVISVVGSAFISFIGFLITIYVVKKSTEAQIESNRKLIDQQSKLKIEELNIIYKHKKTEELRGLISDVSSKALLFLSQIKLNAVYLDLEGNSDDSKFNVVAEYHRLQDSIAKLIAYIRPGIDIDEKIRVELFDLLEESWFLIINKKNNLETINLLGEKIGYTQASLNIFIEELLKEKAA